MRLSTLIPYLAGLHLDHLLVESDLADASNVAARRFRVEPIPFNLTELDCEQIRQTQVGSDRDQISPGSGEPVVSVHDDRDRIAQVRSILTINAAK